MCFVYTGSTHVRGLTLATVASEEEAMAQLFDGETNRAIAEHQLNKASTRYACATHFQVETLRLVQMDNV